MSERFLFTERRVTIRDDMQPLPTERPHLSSIQALRGIAALLVVLFHATQFVDGTFHVPPFSGAFYFGFCGVEIFFVLSGFVILFIHHRDIGMPQRALRYACKRFVRIYPTYWAVLLAITLLGERDWLSGTPTFVLENVTLLPLTPMWRAIPVAWTLSFEIIFYAFVLVAILNAYVGAVLMSIWFAVSFAGAFGIVTPVPQTLAAMIGIDYKILNVVTRTVSSGYNLLFFFGIAAFLSYDKLKNYKHRNAIGVFGLSAGALTLSMAAFYWVVVVGGGNSGGPFDLAHVAFGAAAMFFLLTPLSKRLDEMFARRRILQLLGDASYSIYLVHIWFLELLVPVSGRHLSHDVAGANTAFAIVFVATVVAGVGVHLALERPALAVFGQYCRRNNS